MCNQEEEEKLSLAFHMLIVQDINRALRFYRVVLGLDVQSFDQKNSTPEWARLTLGDDIIVLRANWCSDHELVDVGTAIGLVREGGVDGLVWSGLYFEAYDIPQLCLRIEEGGGRVLSPPRRARDGSIVADLADPDGNVFILFSD